MIIFLAAKRFSKKCAIPPRGAVPDELKYLGGHTMNELLDAEQRASVAALLKNGRPNMTITLPVVDEMSLGELIFMLEMTTAYAGEFYNINAFDQPGVEEGKEFASGLMGRKGFEPKAREFRRLVASKGKYQM